MNHLGYSRIRSKDTDANIGLLKVKHRGNEMGVVLIAGYGQFVRWSPEIFVNFAAEIGE